MTQTPLSSKKDPDIEENKVIAAIGYLGILFLVPLLLKKESKFALFHAKQGLVLFIVEVILMILGWIPILSFLVFLIWIGVVVLIVMGIVQALQGQYWKMPLLGDYAEKIKI